MIRSLAHIPTKTLSLSFKIIKGYLSAEIVKIVLYAKYETAIEIGLFGIKIILLVIKIGYY